MHSLLEKLFNKRGIKDFKELEPEEKQTFEDWQRVLSKDELTVEDIKEFCATQIAVVEAKWSDLNLSQEKKAEFIPYHTVYKLLLSAIDSPKAGKEALEIQLKQLIK